MKLFLLGATGAIGRHLLTMGLERHHEVTAYVRNAQGLSTGYERLKVIQGDLFNREQMAEAMAGHEVVLSSFGPTTLRASTLRRDFGATLAAAMRKSDTHRAVVVSAAFLFPNLGFFGRLLKATVFRKMMPDMAAMEAELRQSDLDWTIVRPPRLTNGPAKHAYRIADGELPARGFRIARADVAHFMMEEAEMPKHVKQIVGICD